jgi:hypothetical protein
MRKALRPRTHVIISCLLLGLCSAITPDASVESHRGGIDAIDQVTRAQEGRLRKLHLVRPDLIPYPIAMEIYC